MVHTSTYQIFQRLRQNTDSQNVLFLSCAESRQPVITSVKKNATAYNGIKQVSVVVGGHLDVVENTRVTIECPVSGSPAPRVAWLFNDQVLSETQIKNEAGFQTFVLEKVSMKDTGKYTCLVKNVIGSDAADTHIFVGKLASILHSLSPKK